MTDGRPGAGWLDRWSIGGHRTARSPPTTAANLIPVAGDFFFFFFFLSESLSGELMGSLSEDECDVAGRKGL